MCNTHYLLNKVNRNRLKKCNETRAYFLIPINILNSYLFSFMLKFKITLFFNKNNHFFFLNIL